MLSKSVNASIPWVIKNYWNCFIECAVTFDDKKTWNSQAYIWWTRRNVFIDIISFTKTGKNGVLFRIENLYEIILPFFLDFHEWSFLYKIIYYSLSVFVNEVISINMSCLIHHTYTTKRRTLIQLFPAWMHTIQSYCSLRMHICILNVFSCMHSGQKTCMRTPENVDVHIQVFWPERIYQKTIKMHICMRRLQ